MLPLVARASEVALRVVPGGLREASEALGATHWKTTWKVVLPSARAGLVTAAILAIARGIGETAVVLVTIGSFQLLELQSRIGAHELVAPLHLHGVRDP